MGWKFDERHEIENRGCWKYSPKLEKFGVYIYILKVVSYERVLADLAVFEREPCLFENSKDTRFIRDQKIH